MPNFPELAILPSDSLVIHEKHDEQRTMPLIRAIKSSKVLRNPPIVSPLDDRSGRYLVLDGANRTMAIQKMDIPHIIAQVIEPDDAGLSLLTWNHVVWEHNPARFLKAIGEISGTRCILIDGSLSTPEIRSPLCIAIIQNCRGRTYLLQAESDDLRSRIEILNSLVNTYKDRGRLDRTSIEDGKFLEDTYPSFCGLVLFPKFSIQDLFNLAGAGYLLPTGITRFTISPRALHINYPLAELSDSTPIEEKNERLRHTIQEKISRKSVRYYAEPTFLFDDSSE